MLSTSCTVEPIVVTFSHNWNKISSLKLNYYVNMFVLYNYILYLWSCPFDRYHSTFGQVVTVILQVSRHTKITDLQQDIMLNH